MHMALISYKNWKAQQQESTAASRAFAAAVRGLMPSAVLVSHGIGGHRTEPLAAKALEKVKIAKDPNTLKSHKKKKRKRKHKRKD